jgi:hypothetical protein
MKKKIALAVLAASVLFSASAFASENVLAPSPVGQQQLVPYGAVSKDGYFKGIRLAGKVKVVKNFGDIKVQVVKNFPDLKVKKVSNFPNKIGEWQFVDSFPDFTIQFVEAFPDIKVQFVEAFPGLP